jgi:hypothetical protein
VWGWAKSRRRLPDQKVSPQRVRTSRILPGPSVMVRLRAWWARRSEPAQRVVGGYAIVVLFFLVFFILARVGFTPWSRAFAERPLVLLLSVAFVAPLLVEFLRPIVSSVKLGALELSFREVQKLSAAAIADLKEIAENAGEYIQGIAVSYYDKVLKQLDDIKERTINVAKEDLGSAIKPAWKFPNLYFLALLLELRSGVRQIVFVHRQEDGLEGFITMCAPRDLRRALERLIPPFAVAAAKWKEAQASSPPQELAPNVVFSDALTEAFNKTSESAGGFNEGWVDPQGLLRVLGLDINLCRIEWKERLTRDDYRGILTCSYPFVAVTQGNRLISVLDQHRVALAVARKLI